MASPIDFVVTDAGLNALLDASKKSIKLSLTTIKLGSGQYKPSASRTTMAAAFTENGISSGGVEVNSFTLRFTAIMGYSQEKACSEIGIYTSTGVLFAIAAKETGSFFKLYPSIDYVANFGLVLDNTASINSINFVLDGRGGLATKLIQDHTLAADPHPQYKAYAHQLLTAHTASADPHPQYALKTFFGDEIGRLEDEIDSLLGITEYLFPPILECGYGINSPMVAARKKGANYSWANRSIVFLYCPENTHEGWNIARDSASITANTYNRSGTSRIGYSGRSNYAVIDTERTLLKRAFIKKTNQLAYEIKSGTFEAGEALSIIREAWETIDYTSNSLVLLITPEGGHEGWSVSRTADKINISIFDRSGTNRIGYSGRVNWSLFVANNTPLPRDKYPFNLITGTSSGSSFIIPAPEGHDFTNPNYFPIITPEGGHEGWSITRQSNGFKVDIFNRSGQSRVGYSGRVSWGVFIMEKPVTRTAYYEGTHKITVKAGKSVSIELYGAGGGGGGSIHNYSSSLWNIPSNGFKGGDAVLTYGAMVLSAGGGYGGGGANWGNGSSFSNGKAGIGGVTAISNIASGFDIAKNVAGNDAVIGSRWERQMGGVATSLASGLPVDNAGGLGAWGIGDEKWSYGGGGGGGAFLQVEFTNRGTSDVELTLNIGAAGLAWKPTEQTSAWSGENGGPAFAVVGYEA